MDNFLFQYQENLAQYFVKQKKTWDWFSNQKVQQQQLTEYRTSLLKNTYRLSTESDPNIYKLVDQAKDKLEIAKDVVIYQELDSMQSNARVSYDEKEIHIVVSGNLLKSLNDQEFLAIIGHELGHMKLYELKSGKFEITNRIITSIANDPRSEQVMIETARLFNLYMELFCDRAALQVVDDVNVVIETLVKVSTGLAKVSAKNYLTQAKEILETENTGSNGQTHPETFIRALALDKWNKKAEEKSITNLIDTSWGLNQLDLFKQDKLNTTTKEILQIICKPKWIRTEQIFSLCRQYFPDFKYNDNIYLEEYHRTLMTDTDDSINEYVSYILLDFSQFDSSLENAPLGHTFQVAENLGIHKTFRKILKKELKLTLKALDKKIKDSQIDLVNLSESQDESILRDE